MNPRRRAIERIQAALKQKPRYDRRWSCARLVVDYLQQTREREDVLSYAGWPFPDMAAQLFPERFAKERRIQELGWTSFPFEACFAGYVHFCEVENIPEIRRYGMSNPYEPIIRLRERGGDLGMGHVTIDTCTIGIPYHHVVVRPGWKLLATDNATLDAFDEEAREEYGK